MSGSGDGSGEAGCPSVVCPSAWVIAAERWWVPGGGGSLEAHCNSLSASVMVLSFIMKCLKKGLETTGSKITKMQEKNKVGKKDKRLFREEGEVFICYNTVTAFQSSIRLRFLLPRRGGRSLFTCKTLFF